MFVGIDVSKDRLDVHMRPGGESFALARDGEGLVKLCERLSRSPPSLVVLEATGGFETIVASALAAAHLQVAVVNPPRSAASLMREQARQNRQDRRRGHRSLCRSHAAGRKANCQRGCPVARRTHGQAPPAHRDDHCRAEPPSRLTSRLLLKAIDRHLALLKQHLAELDEEIGTTIRGTPVWRVKEDLLISVPSIGPRLPAPSSPIRRILAAIAALEDIPHQAMRLARWQAKPIEERRPGRWSPLRPGKPPGFRERPKHEIDAILKECDWLARNVMPPLDDTS
ncbi:MAG: transposase [Hyphomicrobiales bacterium]